MDEIKLLPNYKKTVVIIPVIIDARKTVITRPHSIRGVKDEVLDRARA